MKKEIPTISAYLHPRDYVDERRFSRNPSGRTLTRKTKHREENLTEIQRVRVRETIVRIFKENPRKSRSREDWEFGLRIHLTRELKALLNAENEPLSSAILDEGLALLEEAMNSRKRE